MNDLLKTILAVCALLPLSLLVAYVVFWAVHSLPAGYPVVSVVMEYAIE